MMTPTGSTGSDRSLSSPASPDPCSVKCDMNVESRIVLRDPGSDDALSSKTLMTSISRGALCELGSKSSRWERYSSASPSESVVVSNAFGVSFSGLCSMMISCPRQESRLPQRVVLGLADSTSRTLSIPARRQAVACARGHRVSPRQESNLHRLLRREESYPLNDKE